ncbi:hypothetical protein [Kitasatospora sp. NPDC090091]|uniref:hypothetical protein n=1 Tax=Kitasatospora sp. NPDC090091 TaxID=3364081 RepID=UPI0038274C49
MTPPPPRRPTPGPPATPADLRRAQQQEVLLRTELTRVRGAALAWRNGLAALLAGLVGFGLVKGRSDVGELAPGWAVAVGLLLLAALLGGAVGAALLLRAAHGRFGVVPLDGLPPAEVRDHLEALASARALKRGVVATAVCSALLVAAVATTWYGPSRQDPALRVEYGGTGATACGEPVRVLDHVLVLKSSAGELAVPLDQLRTVQPVKSCAAPGPAAGGR